MPRTLGKRRSIPSAVHFNYIIGRLGRFPMMSEAFIAKFTYSFFCLRELRHFFCVAVRLCCYPVVSVYRHLFIIEATQHVQSAVLAEQVLSPLWLVRTARRTNSLQARVNGCKPAWSAIYPIRNGYLWIINFFCCFWVDYKQRRQASKNYTKRGLSLRSRICHRSGESSNEKEG